jgi:hypothetical protein
VRPYKSAHIAKIYPVKIRPAVLVTETTEKRHATPY